MIAPQILINLSNILAHILREQWRLSTKLFMTMTGSCRQPYVFWRHCRVSLAIQLPVLPFPVWASQWLPVILQYAFHLVRTMLVKIFYWGWKNSLQKGVVCEAWNRQTALHAPDSLVNWVLLYFHHPYKFFHYSPHPPSLRIRGWELLEGNLT